MPSPLMDPALLAFAGNLLSGGQQGGVGFGQSLGGALSGLAQAQQFKQQGARQQQQDLLAAAEKRIAIQAALGQIQQRQQATKAAAAQQQRIDTFAGGQPEELQALAAAFPQLLAEQQAEAAFAAPPDPTSLQQNLAAAGLQPGTPEYQQAVLDTVTKRRQGETGAVKLPNGFQFVDPSNPAAGVVPLRGGPADPTRPTTEQRNKLATAQKTHRQLTGQLGEYAKTLRSGVTNLPGAERDKAKTQRTQIKMQLKNLYELGAITGPDEEILDSLILDPTELSGRAVGLLPGVDSPEDRALSNLGILMQEADRALSAASGNNPKAAQEQAQPSLQDLSTEELLQLYEGLR